MKEASFPARSSTTESGLRVGSASKTWNDPVVSRRFAYGASKHAVVGMTKSAALEFGPRGIRTNAICPSPIETRMMRALERGINPDEPELAHQQMAAGNPMGRYGEPAEVAAFVAYLCSSEASYLNGGIFPIDGGRMAR